MTLQEIAVKNLLRRKARAAFILAGLVAGIATVVAVVTFSEAMTGDINDKHEKYGANILVVPRTDSLSLTYGGVSLGGVALDAEEIHQSRTHGRLHTSGTGARGARECIPGAAGVTDGPERCPAGAVKEVPCVILTLKTLSKGMAAIVHRYRLCPI